MAMAVVMAMEEYIDREVQVRIAKKLATAESRQQRSKRGYDALGIDTTYRNGRSTAAGEGIETVASKNTMGGTETDVNSPT